MSRPQFLTFLIETVQTQGKSELSKLLVSIMSTLNWVLRDVALVATCAAFFAMDKDEFRRKVNTTLKESEEIVKESEENIKESRKTVAQLERFGSLYEHTPVESRRRSAARPKHVPQQLRTEQKLPRRGEHDV